ncbi:MAG: DUF4390 domain-containing protein [Thermoanaerobaculia bacterium]
MRSLALCAVLFGLSAVAFASPDPHIEDLAAATNGSLVSVHFTLADAFENDETVAALESGLPTSFTYVIEMFRDRPNWFDEGIGRSRVEVIATFNSVTREYLLNYRRDRRLVRSETFNDFGTLRKRMTVIEEKDLFDIGGRRPYKIKVRVKADLRRGWLLYLIPWESSTRWREVRLRSNEGATP